MNNELIVVDCGSKTTNGGVVECRLNRWNSIPLSLVHLNGVAIGAVDTQVNDNTHCERCLVTSHPGAEEVLNAGICRHDLIVVGGGGCQTGKCDCI